jgi:hypothetical protein
MPNIQSRPPSFIKIRTMQSDIEEMRSSGGHISGAKILGKRLEEIEKEQPEELPTEKEQEISPEIIKKADEEEEKEEVIGSPKKNKKILPLIIGVAAILILGGAGYYFLIAPKDNKQVVSTPTPTPKPQFSSILKNFAGETELVIYQGNTSNLEQIIGQAFQKSITPNTTKEIALMQNEYNSYPAQSFLKSIYNNFNGVNSSEIPNFENRFSFIINNDVAGKNSIAYAFKINEQGLTTFTIASIKTKFITAFEKFIENNSDILASQYLQNPGIPQKPFLSKEVGAVNAKYLKFSTGSEFYYGFYQNYLVIGTSQASFQKLIELLSPKF